METTLRKVSVGFISFIMALGFVLFGFSPVTANAEKEINEDNISIGSLEDAPEDVYGEIDVLEDQGYEVYSDKVIEIEDQNVLYYEKSDYEFGLIQFNDSTYTKLEATMQDESNPEKVLFQDQLGRTAHMEFNENGEIISAYAEDSESTIAPAISMNQVCQILVTASGTGVNAIYSAAAKIVGGPIAGLAVAFIVDQGVNYISNQC